jgi:hypothetical protein
MDKETKVSNANQAYQIMIAALDNMNWKYKRDDEKLMVRFSATGNDLSTSFAFFIDADRQLIRLLGFLPFEMSEDKRVEGSIATNVANYKFVDGSFDYDIGTGKIIWRMTSSFCDSLLSTDLFRYMIQCSCQTIDQYNDQFLAINEGKMSISEFIEINSK